MSTDRINDHRRAAIKLLFDAYPSLEREIRDELLDCDDLERFCAVSARENEPSFATTFPTFDWACQWLREGILEKTEIPFAIFNLDSGEMFELDVKISVSPSTWSPTLTNPLEKAQDPHAS